ncbi:lytic transglycosylase domain-containing protein [Reichenbachiella ulvae]|uniref:Lytic transglycosylase domain-containing protein n=1 Tax=Reichenbachiella ulvae TaxID=2980104 RepID=A0ABT3CY19_9BACT|nr:lytic transglycosylase domain-containing protein [Reichenbachiella ulvae]MCV9388596.1 lytic transglycosylase domain-containing protein [Reichenbachiella ulvae]
MPKELRYLLIGAVLGGLVVYFLRPEPVAQQVQVPQVLEPQINNGTIAGYSLPDSITFAGERVPMERPDVRERLDREVQVNAFWHSNAIILIKRAHKWLPLLDSILVANEVPSDFKYLAVAESGLQNVISPAGAVGFWQFLKGTAGDFGLIVNGQVDQRYDPIAATVAACDYLKWSYERLGNWTMVAASYNMGLTATRRVVENQRAESYYDMNVSEEPSRYVFRIIALKNLLENPELFSFQVDEEDLYQFPDTKSVVIDSSVSDWNDFAAQYDMSYYQLRQLNPWIRDYKLTLRTGQKYTVLVKNN